MDQVRVFASSTTIRTPKILGRGADDERSTSPPFAPNPRVAWKLCWSPRFRRQGTLPSSGQRFGFTAAFSVRVSVSCLAVNNDGFSTHVRNETALQRNPGARPKALRRVGPKRVADGRNESSDVDWKFQVAGTAAIRSGLFHRLQLRRIVQNSGLSNLQHEDEPRTAGGRCHRRQFRLRQPK